MSSFIYDKIELPFGTLTVCVTNIDHISVSCDVFTVRGVEHNVHLHFYDDDGSGKFGHRLQNKEHPEWRQDDISITRKFGPYTSRPSDSARTTIQEAVISAVGQWIPANRAKLLKAGREVLREAIESNNNQIATANEQITALQLAGKALQLAKKELDKRFAVFS
jgi:hypothetical protein